MQPSAGAVRGGEGGPSGTSGKGGGERGGHSPGVAFQGSTPSSGVTIEVAAAGQGAWAQTRRAREPRALRARRKRFRDQCGFPWTHKRQHDWMSALGAEP